VFVRLILSLSLVVCFCLSCYQALVKWPSESSYLGNKNLCSILFENLWVVCYLLTMHKVSTYLRQFCHLRFFISMIEDKLFVSLNIVWCWWRSHPRSSSIEIAFEMILKNLSNRVFPNTQCFLNTNVEVCVCV